ncbi:MAG: SPFH domain-containing protein [Chloroflexota bacterium]|nr:MAG: virion core protein (lumpy skin disease virus) [Chloroflexota bacterium]
MALLDLVEFTDPTGHTLVARVPPNGDGELRLGSQCIVREGQLAFLARDGRFLDMLAPGRHTLSTNNIPLLIEFIKPVFQGGRSPFRADVYFVSLHQHTDLKWGTPQPIPMRDAQFGMVRLRAFGTFIVQVAEPRRLLSAVVGTRGRLLVQDVEEQLRSSIVARVADVVAERMRERRLSVLDLATEYDELSEMAHAAIRADFANLGLELVRFYINTISVPEDLERRLDQAGGVAALGGLSDFTRYNAAEALRDAAQAGGDGAAGAGLGLGAGLQLGQLLGQSLAAPGQPAVAAAVATGAPTCPRCRSATPVAAKFCPECGASLRAGCPKCGHATQPGAKFCIECGAGLVS